MRAVVASSWGVVAVLLSTAAGLLAAHNALGPYFAVLACGAGPTVMFAFRKRFQILPLSPPWIMTVGLAAVGVAGFFLQKELNGREGGSVTFALSDSDIARTTVLFAMSSTALAVASAITAATLKTVQQRSSALQVKLTDRALGWIGLGCFVPAVVTVLGTGAQLLDRPAHLSEVAGTSLVSVFGGVGIAAAGASGYVASQTRGLRRLLALVSASSYLAINFASSSRGLALVPMVFAVGVFAARRDRRGVAYLAVASLSAALLLPLPLYLRNLNSHGLLPYLTQLRSFSYADVDWYASAQNVLIAFPLAGTVAYYVGNLPLGFLVVALNPLPGTLAGWYNISDYVRFDNATPYSAVGEIGNYGPVAIALVWGALGVVLAVLDARIGYYASIRRPLVGVALATLAGLVLVFALQYNLRSAVRIVMYAVALEVGMRVLVTLRAPSTSDSIGPKDPPPLFPAQET